MSILGRNQLRQIAVLVETDNSWGRNVVQGVADYARKFAQWNLLIDPRDQSQGWSLPDRWHGDGIIARVSTPLHLDEIARSGLPAVNVDNVFENQEGVGQVTTDEHSLAVMALAHFRERGFVHFAYFAPPSHEYSKKGAQAFFAAVTAEGHDCHIYRPGYRGGRRISRDEEHNRIHRWLSHLPKPVAVLAVDARRGRQLAEICSLERISVPDEVAILAGDTDEFLCNLSSPPLSSIEVASQRIGHEAAMLLDRMMHGEPAPSDPLRIQPVRVLARQSTDVLSIDDPMIVQALRFIQTHAFRGISVDDVLREVPVSRRYLELQFKKRIGRLPAEEIRRLRLERGRDLLTQSDLSVEAIAAACGYAGATQFGVAFRKHFGNTPLAFRRQLLRTS
ncbi:substrate-binding domain-containing protein [Lacipirellula sp.]|uniref:AraC family transcriptional regulator n=1 Tax=Lacipirellula sp. TaxID=2691419 RepID=UPI003D0FDEE7